MVMVANKKQNVDVGPPRLLFAAPATMSPVGFDYDEVLGVVPPDALLEHDDNDKSNNTHNNMMVEKNNNSSSSSSNDGCGEEAEAGSLLSFSASLFAESEAITVNEEALHGDVEDSSAVAAASEQNAMHQQQQEEEEEAAAMNGYMAAAPLSSQLRPLPPLSPFSQQQQQRRRPPQLMIIGESEGFGNNNGIVGSDFARKIGKAGRSRYTDNSTTTITVTAMTSTAPAEEVMPRNGYNDDEWEGDEFEFTAPLSPSSSHNSEEEEEATDSSSSSSSSSSSMNNGSLLSWAETNLAAYMAARNSPSQQQQQAVESHHLHNNATTTAALQQQQQKRRNGMPYNDDILLGRRGEKRRATLPEITTLSSTSAALQRNRKNTTTTSHGGGIVRASTMILHPLKRNASHTKMPTLTSRKSIDVSATKRGLTHATGRVASAPSLLTRTQRDTKINRRGDNNSNNSDEDDDNSSSFDVGSNDDSSSSGREAYYEYMNSDDNDSDDAIRNGSPDSTSQLSRRNSTLLLRSNIVPYNKIHKHHHHTNKNTPHRTSAEASETSMGTLPLLTKLSSLRGFTKKGLVDRHEQNRAKMSEYLAHRSNISNGSPGQREDPVVVAMERELALADLQTRAMHRPFQKLGEGETDKEREQRLYAMYKDTVKNAKYRPRRL